MVDFSGLCPGSLYSMVDAVLISIPAIALIPIKV
jgi:hypothetical protein